MSLDALKQRIPEYAKDLKLNLSQLTTVTSLTPQQVWGTALASALASRNHEVVRALEAAGAAHLSPEANRAARAAAAIMAMNNIYYRFTHLAANKDFLTMPARLRMNVIANPGVDKTDFELWSLAVSAVNGCGRCIEAHETELLNRGVTKEAVQDTVRIASIVHAIAVTLDDPLLQDAAAAAA